MSKLIIVHLKACNTVTQYEDRNQSLDDRHYTVRNHNWNPICLQPLALQANTLNYNPHT